jgi:YARHG domain
MKSFLLLICISFILISCKDKKTIQKSTKMNKSQKISIVKINKKKTDGINLKVGNIYPTSSVKLLTEFNVANLRSNLLKFIRYEIQARHGYGFKDKDIQSYFNTQPWYKLKKIPSKFSSLENKNLKLIKKHISKWKNEKVEDYFKVCNYFKKEANVDLDGDGKLDHIYLDKDYFIINKSIKKDLCGKEGCGVPEKCFTIVDININDKQKEIFHVNFRDTMQRGFGLYALKNGKLKTIFNYVGADSITANGFGKFKIGNLFMRILSKMGSTSLDFVMTKAGKFKEIPKKFYKLEPNGFKAKMIRKLAFITSPTNSKIKFILKKGDKVTIEGCNVKYYCRVTNEKNEIGWFEIEKLNLKFDEVFYEIVD